jgi:hypothetical protein
MFIDRERIESGTPLGVRCFCGLSIRALRHRTPKGVPGFPGFVIYKHVTPPE